MKSNSHKKQLYKAVMDLHKNTENFWQWHACLSLFCNFTEYES